MEYHQPVLLNQTIDLLKISAAGIYVDGTLGGGGHSIEICKQLKSGGRCIGFDVDPDAIDHAAKTLSAYQNVLTIVQKNTVTITESLYRLGIRKIDGLLLDLGVSSRQLDKAEKGFTFRQDTVLDLRLDPTLKETAADLVNDASPARLKEIFSNYGEEPYSGKITEAIVGTRSKAPIRTTGELTGCIDTVIFPDKRKKTYARIFQALRIAVNHELDYLEKILNQVPDLLNTGGRLVVISYHSLEDRMVKNFIRDQENPCICPPEFPVCMCHRKPTMRSVTRKALVADDLEIKSNQRSRSARLRAAERI